MQENEKVVQFMFPFSKQPEPGVRVKVFMKDGKKKTASCTEVAAPDFHGLQWYDVETRDAIDVNKIKGWLPI